MIVAFQSAVPDVFAVVLFLFVSRLFILIRDSMTIYNFSLNFARYFISRCQHCNGKLYKLLL